MAATAGTTLENIKHHGVSPQVDLKCYEKMPDSEVDESDGDDTGDEENEKTYQPAPAKQPRIDPEQLLAIRKRLFCDIHERPSQRVFYVGGEIIDMDDPDTCEIQWKLFARIFNTLSTFSKFKFLEKTNTHRNLAWEVQATEKRLKKMKAEKYKDFHVGVSSAVSYVLRALEDIKFIRPDEFIFQLVPITCTIDRNLKERLKVNGIELRTSNNSTSLSVNLNVDVKFLYVGHFQKRVIQDKGEKYFVSPVPYMGNYLNAAVSDLYDLIYSRTREYIQRFFDKNPENPVPLVTDAFTWTCGDTSRTLESKNTEVLKYLLQAVGRDIELKKMDLDKINVFVLTSTIRKNPKYLNPKSESECTIDASPVMDAEAVFLSSFTRARIMEDGLLNFQIYSKACVYTSADGQLPRDIE